MLLENSFEVPASPATVWPILIDAPRIVDCVPGAELVSVEPDGSYKGKITVKLGPIALNFLGLVSIVPDAAAHTALIKAKGADQKGRGNAVAQTTMRMTQTPAGGSLVALSTDLQLSGMVAQYGRASGVISALSNEIIAQFAEGLRDVLGSVAAAAPEAPAAARVELSTDAPVPLKAAGGSVAAGGAGPGPKPVAKPQALGFAFLWRVLIGWLFGRK